MVRTDHDLLGDGALEERLRERAETLANEARWLLHELALPPGPRIVDIGCGPAGILDVLAQGVGPHGKVVGVACNGRSVHPGGSGRRPANLEVLQGDATATGLPRGAFDLAHAHRVLADVPEPQRIVAEMAALVRPGGVVAIHEADCVAHPCDPPLPAWTRLFRAQVTHARRNKLDLFVGRRVPRMLRAAGVVDVRVNPVIRVYPYGDPRRAVFLDFLRTLRDRIRSWSLLPDGELTDLMATLRSHVEHPDTLVLSRPVFQVWGRKPERSGR
jgi:SAM-dependent methyltransferase